MSEGRPRVGRELPAESFDVVLFTTGIIAAKTREGKRRSMSSAIYGDQLPEPPWRYCRA